MPNLFAVALTGLVQAALASIEVAALLGALLLQGTVALLLQPFDRPLQRRSPRCIVLIISAARRLLVRDRFRMLRTRQSMRRRRDDRRGHGALGAAQPEARVPPMVEELRTLAAEARGAGRPGWDDRRPGDGTLGWVAHGLP